MKKLLFLLVIMLLIQSFGTRTTYAEAPDIQAEAAILMNTSNTLTLYEKSSRQQIQPGSLTKIMTAIIAIEKMEDINAPITAAPDIIAGYDFSFGNMGILANETLTVKDLLYGMMIYDAGEAAELLAHNLAGGYDAFLACMNQKAAALGAENTHFTNASGYYDPQQVSTAYDLFLISRYAMESQTFRDIVSTKLYEIPANDHYRQIRYLANTNQMLSTNRTTQYYMPSVKGIKTSYMKEFGHSLSISAQKGNTGFLCIIINSPADAEGNHAYMDATSLLTYGFENFETVRLSEKNEILDEVSIPNGQGTSHVLLVAGENLDAFLPKDYHPEELELTANKPDSVSAPIEAGQALGTMTVAYQSQQLGQIDLCAYEAVGVDYAKDILNKVKWVATSPFFLIPLFLLIAYLIIRTIVINYHKFLQS